MPLMANTASRPSADLLNGPGLVSGVPAIAWQLYRNLAWPLRRASISSWPTVTSDTLADATIVAMVPVTYWCSP